MQEIMLGIAGAPGFGPGLMRADHEACFLPDILILSHTIPEFMKESLTHCLGLR